MAAAEGIVEVHDLHIWTITSGFPALSAHVLVGGTVSLRRRELEELLTHEYGISHTTLQVDHVGDHHLTPDPPLPHVSTDVGSCSYQHINNSPASPGRYALGCR